MYKEYIISIAVTIMIIIMLIGNSMCICIGELKVTVTYSY